MSFNINIKDKKILFKLICRIRLKDSSRTLKKYHEYLEYLNFKLSQSVNNNIINDTKLIMLIRKNFMICKEIFLNSETALDHNIKHFTDILNRNLSNK